MSLQYLTYRSSPATELVWVDPVVGEVPDGAVTCGLTADGQVLYLAKSVGTPCGYDIRKSCVDVPYSISNNHCRNVWKMLILKHCKLNICLPCLVLTHWGRVTHICVGKLTNIGSDNGLSPGRRQAIIWTNTGILLIGTLGTNFSEILIVIHTFSFNKMHLKMSSAKLGPFCLGLNVLIWVISMH